MESIEFDIDFSAPAVAEQAPSEPLVRVGFALSFVAVGDDAGGAPLDRMQEAENFALDGGQARLVLGQAIHMYTILTLWRGCIPGNVDAMWIASSVVVEASLAPALDK